MIRAWLFRLVERYRRWQYLRVPSVEPVPFTSVKLVWSQTHEQLERQSYLDNSLAFWLRPDRHDYDMPCWQIEGVWGELPTLSNSIAYGHRAAHSAISGDYCVVIGDGALADQLHLGENRFHVEGLFSIVVDHPGWQEMVKLAAAEMQKNGPYAGLSLLRRFAPRTAATGSNNVMLGYNAGHHNIMLGYHPGYFAASRTL